jgi:RNA polymerase primary sigma factor
VSRAPRDEPPEGLTLQAYLQEIARLPRLTPAEEHALALRIQRDRDDEALKRLVEGNLRFVVSYAKRYRHLGVGFLDLIHEGNLGLLEAARRFDPARNVKFITYAVWWIRQAIMHALSGQRRPFALPTKLSAVARRFGREISDLTARLDHAPSFEEIAANLDISPAEAQALQFVAGSDLSLSDPASAEEGDERELGETLPQHSVPPAEERLLHEALLSLLQRAMDDLAPKEREVMVLRFGLAGEDPKTLQEIGDRLSVSRERVRQLEARAKDKLRRGTLAGALRSYLN